MTNQGKRYQNIKKQIPEERQDISEGLRICKETASAKFDESIDVVFSLNIDTKDPELVRRQIEQATVYFTLYIRQT